MMASFFNESDLNKCLKNCDFCRIPEKVSQRAMCSKRNVKRVGTHEVSDKMERQKKEEEEYSGFENRLERMKSSNVVAKCVNWQMEELRGKCVESLTIVHREAIVRTAIQALDDNSFQAGNQLTSNTTPAIGSPRRSAPATTSLECDQERDKEWNGIRFLFCFSHLIMIKQCIGILNKSFN
ncbi:hypothetical protein WR25_17955 [Diploscapter pachys]|uniref:Uncharacterized protein n=1 Tax=Diploscapter pachys TaxID=2018661 RepID=A0A2A2LV50_9BILA|nr:hypothetical protein WR25_17955 [Diploscapter pachys]